MATEFLVKDARTFYTVIKTNPLYKDQDDELMVSALDDYYRGTLKIADGISAYGRDREEFMFFQGMLAGALVQAKIFRHHIVTEAAAKDLDPATGEKNGTAH